MCVLLKFEYLQKPLRRQTVIERLSLFIEKNNIKPLIIQSNEQDFLICILISVIYFIDSGHQNISTHKINIWSTCIIPGDDAWKYTLVDRSYSMEIEFKTNT